MSIERQIMIYRKKKGLVALNATVLSYDDFFFLKYITDIPINTAPVAAPATTLNTGKLFFEIIGLYSYDCPAIRSIFSYSLPSTEIVPVKILSPSLKEVLLKSFFSTVRVGLTSLLDPLGTT